MDKFIILSWLFSWNFVLGFWSSSRVVVRGSDDVVLPPIYPYWLVRGGPRMHIIVEF